MANDVYTRRLHCASLPLDEHRPFPRGVFGLDKEEYDMLATRGNHGTYTTAERDFTPPGQHLLQWAASSGRVTTVDEALKADRRRPQPRPSKRNRL